MLFNNMVQAFKSVSKSVELDYELLVLHTGSDAIAEDLRKLVGQLGGRQDVSE
jgi:hypothetical protein